MSKVPFYSPLYIKQELHDSLTKIYSPSTQAHRRVWFFALVLFGKKDEQDGIFYYQEPRHIVYANRTWFMYYDEYGYIEVPKDFSFGLVKTEE